MNPHPHNQDMIDDLLASQPVEPSQNFSLRVLSRLKEVQPLDAVIDDHLKKQPVKAGRAYTDRVLHAVEAEADPKILGFPTWVVALGSIAALLVAGVLAFAVMFQKGWEDAQARVAAQPPARLSEGLAPGSAVLATNSESDVSPADIHEWEELLVMQETLAEIAALNERKDWETLALLIH